jgi:phosphotriesterase-related protein
MGGSYSTNAMDADDPIRRTSAEALAERFITESIHGVGNTGIRPGILGEIGTGPTVLEDEAKVLRASAWAHHETGLALSIHLHPWSKAGHEVLDILAREAVPSHRIVLGHLNPYVDDLSYIRSLLERGVYAEFDLFGFDHSLLTMGRYAPSDFDVAQAVVELMDQYSERILISHDIGVKTRLHRFGGWGYDHILVHVVPLLRNLGLKEAAVELLMVGNPRSVLILDPLPSYLGKFASSVEAK